MHARARAGSVFLGAFLGIGVAHLVIAACLKGRCSPSWVMRFSSVEVREVSNGPKPTCSYSKRVSLNTNREKVQAD